MTPGSGRASPPDPGKRPATDPATIAIHADTDVEDVPGIAPPVHVATTYDRTYQDALVYRRSEHPTTDRLEAVLGALEGGHAVAYPSGMAATLAVLRLLRPVRIALPADVYHGTRKLVATEAEAGVSEVVRPHQLRAGDVWWIETPSNPKCEITDIAATAAAAVASGAVLVVDSTFATPVLQQPLRLGAALVVHSATKFISGHSDAMGGVVVAPTGEEADRLRHRRMEDGAVPGAFDVWLALRGVRTLPLRVARQSATAAAIAAWLTGRVPTVWHPSLPSHSGHDVARRQMSGFGGVLSFEVESAGAAEATVDRLRLFRKATSLGGVESLVEWRRSVDDSAPEGLIRLSIGLEAEADLISDLAEALD